VLSGVLGVWNLPDLLFGRLINKEREGEGEELKGKREAVVNLGYKGKYLICKL